MSAKEYLNGSPLGSLINDFNSIPADSDLRELALVEMIEIEPAAWTGEMEFANLDA